MQVQIYNYKFTCRDMFVPDDYKPKLKQMADSYLDEIFKFYDQLMVSYKSYNVFDTENFSRLILISKR